MTCSVHGLCGLLIEQIWTIKNRKAKHRYKTMFILYECWIQMLFKSMYNLFLKNEHRMLISIYNKSYMMKHWAGHSVRSYSNDFQMTWLINLKKHWSYVWKLKSHFIIKIQVIFDIKWYCTPISIIFTHARRQIHNSQKQPYQKYSTKHSWLEHFTHHSDSIVSRARTQKVDKNLDTTIT